MLCYLYTLNYDDDGAPASAHHYMIDGTKLTASQKVTTTTTPRLSEMLLRHSKKMMNNVVVYAIAQKYDIEGLKELATAKFRDLLFLEEPNDTFPNIIGAVYETSSITDPGLRLVATRYCAHYSTQILADDHLCGVIKDHGELGLEVLREVNKKVIENRQDKERLPAKLPLSQERARARWERYLELRALKEQKTALGRERVRS